MPDLIHRMNFTCVEGCAEVRVGGVKTSALVGDVTCRDCLRDGAIRLPSVQDLSREVKAAEEAVRVATEKRKRQEFIDRAATEVLSVYLLGEGQAHAAERAYDAAEVLWAERCKRAGGSGA